MIKTLTAQARVYPASELGLADVSIPHNILNICKTLHDANHQAYLVGGCIRDWLMGKSPKDFDISTDATPEQVRRLFKRSRIIGRRFKIVHIYLRYRDYVEIATFRAPPEQLEQQQVENIHIKNDKGRLVRDNVYGTIEDDAFRRDFTANALYFDPVNQQVLDYVDGYSAIQDRRLEMIGEPMRRFEEDPVRMLRALRFIAKLNFDIDAALSKLIKQNAYLLRDVSNARLYDETFKLFHHAHGVESWAVLSEYGLVDILFPLTAKSMSKQTSENEVDAFIKAALDNTDRRVEQAKPVIPAFFFAVILWHWFLYTRDQHPNLPKGHVGTLVAADKVMLDQYPRIAIPRRVFSVVAEIWDMQNALQSRRPKQILKLLDSKRFRASYDFLLLRQKIGEVDQQLTQWWTHIQNADPNQREQMIAALAKPHSQGKSRNSNRKRRAKSKEKSQ